MRMGSISPLLYVSCSDTNDPYPLTKDFAVRESRHTLNHNLYAVAEQQGGYFTAAQAAESGYRYPQQVYQRRIGAWEPIDRGIFRLRHFPPGEHEDLIRWSLWSRNRRGETQVTVSHDTAADLYGFGDVMPAKVHLTVPPGFRKPAPDACVLHVARLPPEEIVARGGFKVTTPLRTVLDLADSSRAEDQFAKVLRDALRSGRVRRKQLPNAALPERARRRVEAALAAIGEAEAAHACAAALRDGDRLPRGPGGPAAAAGKRQPDEPRARAAAGGLRALPRPPISHDAVTVAPQRRVRAGAAPR